MLQRILLIFQTENRAILYRKHQEHNRRVLILDIGVVRLKLALTSLENNSQFLQRFAYTTMLHMQFISILVLSRTTKHREKRIKNHGLLELSITFSVC